MIVYAPLLQLATFEVNLDDHALAIEAVKSAIILERLNVKGADRVVHFRTMTLLFKLMMSALNNLFFLIIKQKVILASLLLVVEVDEEGWGVW